ncbi:hypothetical protein [Legionella sp. W05-934-2]|jgi:hypothetical protein|uniref:hypothetical protein n=1 Tax=Legionella sp. W05-934-2 TaxID=1198649 RepID=UPI00346377CF
MESLILHPTDMSQWHALVNEAQQRSQLMLKENTESYLVLMLMRYAQKPRLIESILAIDYFQSLDKPKKIQIDLLQDLGDKSLLFCGLFPGVASRRRVSISYYAKLGRSAYYSISELVQQDDNLFYHLGHQFQDLQMVLEHLRIESWIDKQLELIQ